VVVGVADHFPKLLQGPGRTRMCSNVEVRQTSRTMLDDDEHVEHPKRRGDGHEEVARQNRPRMIFQKD
jgi:hypothetical protein